MKLRPLHTYLRAVTLDQVRSPCYLTWRLAESTCLVEGTSGRRPGLQPRAETRTEANIRVQKIAQALLALLMLQLSPKVAA